MSDEENIIINNDQKDEGDSHLFQTPLWYFRLNTRSVNYSNILFLILFFSLITAIVIDVIFIILYRKNLYYTQIPMILFIILWVIFYYIFWKLLAKGIQLNIFEKFAFSSKKISIDLDHLSIDSELASNLIFNINSLEDISTKIAKMKKTSDKKIKESLEDFSIKLDNLFLILEKPNDNKMQLSELSKIFSVLADNVYYNKDINHSILLPIVENLNKIVKPTRIEKFKNFLSSRISIVTKSYYLKGTLFIVIDVGIFFGIFLGSQNYLGVDKNYAFTGAIAVAGVILHFIYKSLKK